LFTELLISQFQITLPLQKNTCYNNVCNNQSASSELVADLWFIELQFASGKVIWNWL